jgi:hypothetical protein
MLGCVRVVGCITGNYPGYAVCTFLALDVQGPAELQVQQPAQQHQQVVSS